MRVAGLLVNLIPPPQPDQSPAGNVLQVVEVDSKKEDCDDEDENAGEPGQDCVSQREAASQGGDR